MIFIFITNYYSETLEDYGEYIYDVGGLDDKFRILSTPNGLRNLDALRDIMVIAERAQKHKISIKCYYLINYDGILLLLLNKLLYLDIIVDMNLLD